MASQDPFLGGPLLTIEIHIPPPSMVVPVLCNKCIKAVEKSDHKGSLDQY